MDRKGRTWRRTIAFKQALTKISTQAVKNHPFKPPVTRVSTQMEIHRTFKQPLTRISTQSMLNLALKQTLTTFMRPGLESCKFQHFARRSRNLSKRVDSMAFGLRKPFEDFQHMLSDHFNNTIRELLAPKGVAKWCFDPSSGLLIPQGGVV